MGISQKHQSSFALTLVVCAVFALGSSVVSAADGPVRVQLTDEQMKALAGAGIGNPPETGYEHPRIATALLEICDVARVRGDWRSTAENHGLLVEGDSVLVEMRVNPDWARASEWYLENVGGRVRHHGVPSLMEVWLPVGAIEKIAEHKDIHLIRPARLVQPTVGVETSEGVAALNVNTVSVNYDYHDLGADGSGVTIANIDAGYSGYVALQTSGDWPQPANLLRYEVDGSAPVDCDASTCSNYEASSHGAATMEIVFDVAPGADYLTYRTTTVGDWYAALVHAADSGADVVTVSLSAPLDNVGDGSVCPPNFSTPCGTIAEAAAYARSQGTLLVSSAGNNRLIHWGGTYVDSNGYLNWDGAGSVYNIGGPGGGSVYCYPNTYPLYVDLFWDDWTDVDHNYDLYLYEWNGRRWRTRSSSTFSQNGGVGQTPQEAIRYTVSGALGGGGICGTGSGIFSIRVRDRGTASDRNLQVFAGNWGALWNSTPDHSLGFPADSPDVYAAGAVDVASPSTLEDYSAEGPVLGPGGSQATPSPDNPKPDGVSVSGVSTVSYGPSGFGGTSSAAPHVAGVAAILTQLRNEKYATPPATNNPDGIHDLLSTFALEDPTFPSTFDTTYGNGLVKLRFCDQSVSVSNNEWIMLGMPCTRRNSSSVTEVFEDDLDLDNVYWEVWDWDASNEIYRQLGATDQMKPGVGYWLLYEGNATVDIQGLMQDRSEAYAIPLVGELSTFGRLNLIGHPFDAEVNWPDVTVVYGGSEHTLQEAFDDHVFRNYMWTPYTNTGYVNHDGLLGEGILRSFDGFWVKPWQDCELRIPISLSAAAAEASRVSRNPSGWTVRLDATALGVTTNARIGQLPDSLDQWDAHEAELIRSNEAHQFYVVMPHPDWGEFSGDYVRDYHPPRRTDVWRFDVRSNLGGEVVLRWDGPKSVLEQSVVVDLETGLAIPAMKLEKEGYVFKMPPGAREFLWRVR